MTIHFRMRRGPGIPALTPPSPPSLLTILLRHPASDAVRPARPAPHARGARPRPLAAGRRRPLFNPTASVMVMAVLLTLPALFFVSQRAHRSETGYSILPLARELTQCPA